jgi:hypothetical protein
MMKYGERRRGNQDFSLPRIWIIRTCGRFSPGEHHGMLLVRLYLPGPKDLVERVNEIFYAENVRERAGCFVVAIEHKIRLLKPPDK